MRSPLLALLALAMLAAAPVPARAQLSAPCEVRCGLVLGATSFVVATGTAAALGRASGGFSTTTQGIMAWSAGLVLAAGGGIALSGNGARQERAVYAAGIGALAGGITGLLGESLFGESTPATRLAATFVGGALGGLIGGVAGAATWSDESLEYSPVQLSVFSIPVGF